MMRWDIILGVWVGIALSAGVLVAAVAAAKFIGRWTARIEILWKHYQSGVRRP